jgi:hypothetical protein
MLIDLCIFDEPKRIHFATNNAILECYGMGTPSAKIPVMRHNAEAIRVHLLEVRLIPRWVMNVEQSEAGFTNASSRAGQVNAPVRP